MNKRDFVLGGAALALGGAAAGSPSTQPASTAHASLKRLPDLAAAPDLEQWRGYLGETFALAGAAGTRTLRLEHLTQTRRDAHTCQFMLKFRALAGSPGAGALQTLHHANGQRLPLWLEPSATDPGVFIAQFNRLT
jgi:hypothetical protein